MDKIQAYATAFTGKNGVDTQDGIQQGAVEAPLDELELSMDDSELIALKNRYTASSKGDPDIDRIRKENFSYWKGNPKSLLSLWGDSRPLADNVIFEAIETLLPIATKKNPEPVVDGGQDEAGKQLADDVRKMLIAKADELRLKLVLKKGVRHWAMSRIGVWKVGWNDAIGEIAIQSVRPDKIVLDSKAIIGDDLQYTGEFIGENRTDMASVLIQRFPKKKEEILAACDSALGTRIGYMEWWTPDYLFYTMENVVLGKFKNPHWNYEGETTETDQYGNEIKVKTKGSNHFKIPRIPYVFMTVFNTDAHPYDDTSLIEQTKNLQDMVYARMHQIERNAKNTNAGMRISGDHFTQEQAGRAAKALEDGKAVWVPTGDVNASISRDIAPALPQFIYNSLQDGRQRIMSIIGVQGSTPTGISGQETVRGKILAKTSDDSRIGGGITEYLEQVADQIFNWMVQLMYVYYDEPHVASIIGDEGAREYVTLRSSDLVNQQLFVSVKEGSLIPDDPLTKANQAIDLYGAGAISLLDLHKRLGDGNPMKTAGNVILERQNPMALYPELAQQMPQPEQPQPQGGGASAGSQPDLAGIPPAQPDGGQALSQDLLNSVPVG
jgi:hypothetical protein